MNTKGKGRVNKGAPSGLVISLLFHAAAFFIAGLFVVFTVVNKKEPEFTPPPPVERPKMQLKKPKVKVKKSSQPKPSSRIVAKVKSREMPEIQLPDLAGSGEGLLGGSGIGGEFMDLPEIAEISHFGASESIGNDLMGTFYDLKRTRSGNSTAAAADPHTSAIAPILRQVLESGWSPAALNRYHRSNRKLYSTTLVIPETPSVAAPIAFGEGVDVGGYSWAVLYEGTLVSYRDIRFRFWGMGDNFIAVGVDGETVFVHWLDGLDSDDAFYFAQYVNWRASPTPLTYAYAHEGEWIELKAGEPHKMQVLIAEYDGGGSSFMLCVEEDGVEYPLNPYRSGRQYPIFQTAMQSRTQIEELERVIYPGDASINEGPVFQDFEPSQPEPIEEEVLEEVADEEKSEVRSWTMDDGQTVEAELVNQTTESVWIKTGDGREVKVPADRFSEADRHYLALCKIPKMRVDFTERIKAIVPPPASLDRFDDPRRPVEIKDYTFKARVKIIDTQRYTYPLTVEYFAIGREREGDNYILWNRQTKTFTPSKENGFMFEFESERPIRRICASMQILEGSRMRGEVYDGYLVTVTDERGEIIAHRTSNEFLFRNLERLKKIPLTRHFNRDCIRVAPGRPIDGDRMWADAVFDRSLY